MKLYVKFCRRKTKQNVTRRTEIAHLLQLWILYSFAIFALDVRCDW